MDYNRIVPTKFDSQTRLSLMAALIFGLTAEPGREPDIKRIVETVFRMDDVVNSKLKELKAQNNPQWVEGR